LALSAFLPAIAETFYISVFTVVSGGIGTIAVVLAVAVIYPQLRDLGSLLPTIPTTEQPQS
jgi:hypothetical protein